MSFPDVKPKLEPNGSYSAHRPSTLPSGAGSSTGADKAAPPRRPMEKPVDEELTIELPAAGAGQAWAIRIPTFLYEKWAMVRQEGVHLGTILVDGSTTPATVRLKIPKDEVTAPTPAPSTSSTAGSSSSTAKAEPTDPSEADTKTGVKAEDMAAWTGYDTTFLPAMFEMNIPNERSKNTYVMKEKKRDSVVVRDGALGKRKREKAFPKITNAVAHECHLHPIYDETYERILRARRLENEVSRRPIQHLEDYATQGRINQLSSGHAAIRSSFGTGMASLSREPPKSKDKLPRQDRHLLRDRLFTLFREKPYWNISVLKTELNQPDVWLREVLRDVAVQVKEGPYRDMWELKEALRMLGPGVKVGDEGVKGEIKDEGDAEDGDESDEFGGDEEFDEDDFEEVMG